MTGRRVSSYEVQDNNVPGQSLSKGQLRIYRPQVVKTNDNERGIAPSVISDREDVRPPSEINSPSQTVNRKTYNNTRLEQQQDAVNQPNAIDQQNANTPNNRRRENSSNTNNTSENASAEPAKNSRQRK